jgi:hypothetical protein
VDREGWRRGSVASDEAGIVDPSSFRGSVSTRSDRGMGKTAARAIDHVLRRRGRVAGIDFESNRRRPSRHNGG